MTKEDMTLEQFVIEKGSEPMTFLPKVDVNTVNNLNIILQALIQIEPQIEEHVLFDDTMNSLSTILNDVCHSIWAISEEQKATKGQVEVLDKLED